MGAIPKSTKKKTWRYAWQLFPTVIMIVFCGACEDPPPPPPAYGSLVIKIRVEPPTEPDPDDASTEQVITVDSTERSFTLVGNLEDEASRQLVWLTVPVGHVMQVRFIVASSGITLRG
jgi:hypothetical protein